MCAVYTPHRGKRILNKVSVFHLTDTPCQGRTCQLGHCPPHPLGDPALLNAAGGSGRGHLGKVVRAGTGPAPAQAADSDHSQTHTILPGPRAADTGQPNSMGSRRRPHSASAHARQGERYPAQASYYRIPAGFTSGCCSLMKRVDLTKSHHVEIGRSAANVTQTGLHRLRSWEG